MAGSDRNECMEYLEIVKKTFKTEEEAYMFYVGYARKKGFGVRKDDLKYRGPGQNKMHTEGHTSAANKDGGPLSTLTELIEKEHRGVFLGVGVPLFFRLSYKIAVASGSSRILWTSITICLSLLT